MSRASDDMAPDARRKPRRIADACSQGGEQRGRRDISPKPTWAAAWRAVCFGVVLLTACASLPPRNPPRIDIAGVALDRIEGPDAYFIVAVKLTNEGDEDIVVTSLDGRLAIEDENVAQATLVQPPVRIPAHGSARAEMQSRTGMDALLRAIAAAMRRGATIVAPGARPTLRYAIEGSATLGGGFRLPFSRAGELGEAPK